MRIVVWLDDWERLLNNVCDYSPDHLSDSFFSGFLFLRFLFVPSLSLPVLLLLLPEGPIFFDFVDDPLIFQYFLVVLFLHFFGIDLNSLFPSASLLIHAFDEV